MKQMYNLKLSNIKIFLFYFITWLTTMVVLSKSQNAFAQEYVNNHEVYICQGDTLPLPPPPNPPNALVPIFIELEPLQPAFYDPYDDVGRNNIIWQEMPCSYSSITALPDNGFISNIGAGMLFFPSSNTNYQITHQGSGFCAFTYITNIQVNITCNAKNNLISQRYPWLAEMTDIGGCDFSSIDEYEKNGLQYLYTNSNAGKILYYKDGTELCKTNADYNCLEAYQLINKVNNWSCNETENPVVEVPQIFNNYPWLSETINQNNCTNETITVYDADTYEFLIVETALGEIMYSTNGEIYCFSPAGGFSFLGLYDESRIIEHWAYDEGFHGRKSTPIMQEKGFQIFPNPTTGKVFINLKEHFDKHPLITIYDVSGKEVQQILPALDDWFASVLELDVSEFNKGMYLVEVRTAYTTAIEKLIIE